MKKSTKIYMAAAGGCVALGLLLAGIGLIGGAFNRENAGELREEGRLKAEEYIKNSNHSTWKNGENIYGNDRVSLEADQNVEELDIRLERATVVMEKSEDGQIHVEGSEEGEFQAYIQEDTLHIRARGKQKNNMPDNCSRVVIYLPESLVWNEIELSLSAGELEAERLVCEELNVAVAAAQFSVDYMECRNAAFAVSAGEAVVEEGVTGELKADISAGDFSYNGEVQNNAEVECSAGDADLFLMGKRENYNYKISAAMGSVKLDGEEMSALAGGRKIDNGSERIIEVDAAMGDVEIEFSEN